MRPDNTAESICPHCGTTTTFEVDSHVRPARSLRALVRCECGHSHAVYLDRRSCHRKRVALSGVVRLRGDTESRPMVIRDLSRTGLLFEPGDDHDFAEGERFLVDFSFGTVQPTYVHKAARVRRSDDGCVGAEFFDGRKSDPLDWACDLALAQFKPMAD